VQCVREKGMFLRCGYVVNRMDSFSLYVSLSIKKSDRTLAELFDFAEIIAEESTDPIIVTERTLQFGAQRGSATNSAGAIAVSTTERAAGLQ